MTQEASPFAFVTGASSGIGAAISAELAHQGLRVLRGVRRPAPSDEYAVRLDLTDRGSVERAAETVATMTSGALSVLVQCAGIGHECPAAEDPPDDVATLIQTNLTGTIWLTNALLPYLGPATGRIVFISSIAGRRGYALWSTYCASKFGLEGYAAALREEVRGTGVSVSVVRPGAVDTPLYEWKAEQEKRDFMSSQAVARVVAQVCRFNEPNAMLEEVTVNNLVGDL